MTPRTAMGKKDAKKASFISAPELHGEGPVAIASNGKVHASIGINGKLALWDAGAEQAPVPGDAAASGGARQEGADQAAGGARREAAALARLRLRGHQHRHPPAGRGPLAGQGAPPSANGKLEIYEALMLGDAKMSERFTWTGFSSCVAGLLAVGTDGGRVMLFDPKTNKLTAQADGKHPGKHVAIVSGDFLADGRLAVASGGRMKVSAPIGLVDDKGGACPPKWSTYAKFYISGMVSKIPIAQVSTTKNYDSTPGFVACRWGRRRTSR